VANRLQIPVKLEWIDFTVWVGRNKQLSEKSQNLENKSENNLAEQDALQFSSKNVCN